MLAHLDVGAVSAMRNRYRFKVGDRVRSVRDIKNGWAELPSGTVFTVTRRFAGYGLRSDPCKCCGIRVHVTRVQEWSVIAENGE